MMYRGAHPRACGENLAVLSLLAAFVGSSPRVRGKLLALGDLAAEPRLIPARAGKTPRLWTRSR